MSSEEIASLKRDFEAQNVVLAEQSRQLEYLTTQIGKMAAKIDGTGDPHTSGIYPWVERQREADRRRQQFRDYLIKTIISAVIGAAALVVMEWRLDAHLQEVRSLATSPK